MAAAAFGILLLAWLTLRTCRLERRLRRSFAVVSMRDAERTTRRVEG
jgi:hypothetical protein